MEFLMTYGWAILVVLVVIAALAYFGVLSPDSLLPDKCAFPITLTCTDYNVKSTSPQIQFTVVNNGAKDIAITRVEVKSSSITGNSGLGCYNNTPVTISQGSEFTFSVGNGPVGALPLVDCTLTASGRAKDKYLVNITYQNAGSTFTKYLQGQILAKREQ